MTTRTQPSSLPHRPAAAASEHSHSGSPAQTQAGSSKPAARFRLRIMAGDVVAVGPGKIALLEAVAATGSITAAAKSLGMSYRRAWLLLDEINSSLKQPAVDSSKGGQHGGGTALTDVGREMVDLYRRVERDAARTCKVDIDRLQSLLAR